MAKPLPKDPNGVSRDFLFDTKAVAAYLKVNEKMIYSLVSEKGLPATKVTGKWLFPKQLVDQWLEIHTQNYPQSQTQLPPYHGLLIITGSNDPLLDKTLTLFNRNQSGQVAVFGNLGSMGGLQALRQGLCHIAASHLLQEDETEYNFEFAIKELNLMPAVINFCRREQGILVAKGNPEKIQSITDLGRNGMRIVNRQLGTGTRLLLDRELKREGIKTEKIDGYQREVSRHIDVGLEILAGRADAGPAIRAVAGILDLDFIPLRWERFDFMIDKDRFFEEGIQHFLGLLHEAAFRDLVSDLGGYDISLSGKMIFPNNLE